MGSNPPLDVVARILHLNARNTAMREKSVWLSDRVLRFSHELVVTAQVGGFLLEKNMPSASFEPAKDVAVSDVAIAMQYAERLTNLNVQSCLSCVWSLSRAIDRTSATSTKDSIGGSVVHPSPIVDDISPLPPRTTTLVIRNAGMRTGMPNLRDWLLSFWPPNGSYNFFYVPRTVNKRRWCNYAFINFVSHEAALAFRAQWHGRSLGEHTKKTLSIGAASVQGLGGALRLSRRRHWDPDQEHIWPTVYDGVVKLDFQEVLAWFSWMDDGSPPSGPIVEGTGLSQNRLEPLRECSVDAGTAPESAWSRFGNAVLDKVSGAKGA